MRESVVFGIAVFSYQISKSVHNPGFEPRTFGSVCPCCCSGVEGRINEASGTVRLS